MCRIEWQVVTSMKINELPLEWIVSLTSEEEIDTLWASSFRECDESGSSSKFLKNSPPRRLGEAHFHVYKPNNIPILEKNSSRVVVVHLLPDYTHASRGHSTQLNSTHTRSHGQVVRLATFAVPRSPEGFKILSAKCLWLTETWGILIPPFPFFYNILSWFCCFVTLVALER